MEPFRDYDTIVAIDEMTYANPVLADLMRKHRVFAAVPVPQGLGADSVITWVFLGEELSETVYSSRDFAMVGLLFQRMEIVFLSQLGDVRTEMGEIRKELRDLQKTCAALVEQVGAFVENRTVEPHRQQDKSVTALVKSIKESNSQGMKK
ncbi:MAG: hypothetical protein ACYC9J_06900 [Sulfuricaulis sp.]